MTPVFLILAPLFFALLMPLFSLMRFIDLRLIVALFCGLLSLLPLSFFNSLEQSGVIIQNINFFSRFNLTLTLGFFELMFIVFFSLLSLVIVLYEISYREVTTAREGLWHTISFLFSLAGSFGMLLSSHFGNLLFFFVFTNISISWLIQSHFTTPRVQRLYFGVNLLSSLFLLLGILLIYHELGEGNIYHFNANLHQLNPLTLHLALGFFLLSFLIKVEIFPFNVWIANLFRASEPQNVSLFAAVTTKAYFIALIQLLAIFFKLIPWLGEWLVVLGGASLVLAIFYALRESSIKRALAYSSMSQIGGIVMGFGYNLPSINEGLFFHLINHSLAISLMSLSIGYIAHLHRSDEIAMLRGCSIAMPFSSLLFTLGAMSLIGLPPFSGFFSKLIILKGLADHHLFVPILLILIASMGESLLYFRFIRLLYSNRPALTLKSPANPRPLYLSITFLALLLLFLGLSPSSLFFIASRGVEEFMNGKILIPSGIEALQ